MDANTPATQPIPRENPNETTPSRSNPIQDVPPTPSAGKPARPKGPNATAVVLGLAALVLAGLIIAGETMSLRVNWSQLGPGAIVGIGLVLVVLGAVGLIRRHDEA